MKRFAIPTTVVLAGLAALTGLSGCSTSRNTVALETKIYRTQALPLGVQTRDPVMITLGAGDPVGIQVRDTYLARARGIDLPIQQAVVVAQTKP